MGHAMRGKHRWQRAARMEAAPDGGATGLRTSPAIRATRIARWQLSMRAAYTAPSVHERSWRGRRLQRLAGIHHGDAVTALPRGAASIRAARCQRCLPRIACPMVAMAPITGCGVTSSARACAGMTPDVPILELRDASTRFPLRNAWGDVPGGCWRWMGCRCPYRAARSLGLSAESGCGKTTLGKTIAGIFQPSAGEILFEGSEIGGFHQPRDEPCASGCQYCYQDPGASLDPHGKSVVRWRNRLSSTPNSPPVSARRACARCWPPLDCPRLTLIYIHTS